MESPPKSKKLSSTPTLSRPSTSHQIPASNLSSSVLGSTYPTPDSTLPPGSGNLLLSTFPLTVNGRLSIPTYLAGTMYSGNLPLMYCLSSASPASPTTYATSRRSSARSPPLTTTALSTPGCSPSTTSTSPNSTR